PSVQLKRPLPVAETDPAFWLKVLPVPVTTRSTAVGIERLLSMFPLMARTPPEPTLNAIEPVAPLVSVPVMFRVSLNELPADSRRIVPLLVTVPTLSCALPVLLLPWSQTVAEVERLASSVEVPSARMVCDPAVAATLIEPLRT